MKSSFVHFLLGAWLVFFAGKSLACDTPVVLQVPDYMQHNPTSLSGLREAISVRTGDCDEAVKFVFQEEDTATAKLDDGEADIALIGASELAERYPELGKLFVGYKHHSAEDYLNANKEIEFSFGKYQTNGLMVSGAKMAVSTENPLFDRADFGLQNGGEIEVLWSNQVRSNEVISIVDRPAGFYPLFLVSAKGSRLPPRRLDAISKAFADNASERASAIDREIERLLENIPDSSVLKLSHTPAEEIAKAQDRLLELQAAMEWPDVKVALQCAKDTCPCGQRNVCSKKCCENAKISWD